LEDESQLCEDVKIFISLTSGKAFQTAMANLTKGPFFVILPMTLNTAVGGTAAAETRSP
jgi:hypothetical protein